MVVKIIESSPTDENFRKHMRELIDSAKKEILVIACELGSYRFPDLKWAFKRASKRGVNIRIYASNLPHKILKETQFITSNLTTPLPPTNIPRQKRTNHTSTPKLPT